MSTSTAWTRSGASGPNRPARGDHGEEVALHERAARVVGELRGSRQQPLSCQPMTGASASTTAASAPAVHQRGPRGVAQPEPADDDVELVAGEAASPSRASSISATGNRLDMRYSSPSFTSYTSTCEGQLEPPAQADLAHRGVLPVQLLERLLIGRPPAPRALRTLRRHWPHRRPPPAPGGGRFGADDFGWRRAGEDGPMTGGPHTRRRSLERRARPRRRARADPLPRREADARSGIRAARARGRGGIPGRAGPGTGTASTDRSRPLNGASPTCSARRLSPCSPAGSWRSSRSCGCGATRAAPDGSRPRAVPPAQARGRRAPPAPRIRVRPAHRRPDRAAGRAPRSGPRPARCRPARAAAARRRLPPRRRGTSWSRSRGPAASAGCRCTSTGRRIWESAPRLGHPPAEIAALADSVYVSFYKGLGGLAGAAVAGPEEEVAQARLWRTPDGRDALQPAAVCRRRPCAVSTSQLPRMAEYHDRAELLATADGGSAASGSRRMPPHTNGFASMSSARWPTSTSAGSWRWSASTCGSRRRGPGLGPPGVVVDRAGRRPRHHGVGGR